jgi:arylsulfatase A-like enzyme
MTKNYKASRLGVLVVLTAALFSFACSKKPSSNKEVYFSLIDHIEKAEVQGKSIELPYYENIRLNEPNKLWKIGKNGINLLPLHFKKETQEKKENNKNEFIKASFDFLNVKNKKQSEPKVVQEIPNKKFTQIKAKQWQPVIGDWNISNDAIKNEPLQTDKIIYNKHYVFEDKSLSMPKELNLMVVETKPFFGGQVVGKIKFNTKPLTIKIPSEQKVFGLSGFIFRSRSTKPNKLLNGLGILINKDADMIFGKITNSKFVSPEIFKFSHNKKSITGDKQKPEWVSRKLSVTISRNNIQVTIDNKFKNVIPISIESHDFDAIGILNGIKEDTEFSGIEYKIKEIQNIYEPERNRKIAGIYSCQSDSNSPFLISLDNDGFLHFGKMNEIPIKSKFIQKKKIQNQNTLKVFFSKNQYSIFLNNHLELEIKPPSQETKNKEVTACKNSWGLMKKGPGVLFKEIIFHKSSNASGKKALEAWDTFSLLKSKFLDSNYDFSPSKYLITNLVLDQTTQNGVITNSPSEIKYKVKIPKNSYLSFGTAALHQDLKKGKEVTFSISIQVGSKSHEIFNETLNSKSSKGWKLHRADLSSFAGQEVKIIFQTRGKKETFAFWGDPQILTQRENNEFNVILISIDTLRADHLSSYGYPRKTSPNMSVLAKDGVLFKNAISQAPWTYPSHAAMLTSLYPSAMGYEFSLDNTGSSDSFLPRNATTLSEVLKYNGYLTAGFVGGGPIASDRGFSRGFSYYNEKWTEKIEIAYNEITNWISKYQKDKFFLFFHTFEVHEYPPGNHEIFASKMDSSAGIERTIALYDGKIKLVDDYIGLLIQFLKRLNLDKKTLLIITSDHGETFNENGLMGHGYDLNDNLLKIPLIFHLPGKLPKNLKVDQQVRTIDIMPTILDILNIPLNEKIDGESLRIFFEKKSEDRIAFSEATSFYEYISKLNPTSIRTNQHKYIEYPPLDPKLFKELKTRTFVNSHFSANFYEKNPKSELYDLVKNPKEPSDELINDKLLKNKYSKEIRNFKRANAKKWAALKSKGGEKGIALRNETRNRLQALGYLQ